MSKMTTIEFEVDEDTKEKFTKMVESLYLDVPVAMMMFVKSVINTKSIPLEYEWFEVPNEETIAAFKEVENNSSAMNRYNSTKELFDKLNISED